MRPEIGRMEAFDALLETLLKPPAADARGAAVSDRAGDPSVQRSREKQRETRPKPSETVGPGLGPLRGS